MTYTWKIAISTKKYRQTPYANFQNSNKFRNLFKKSTSLDKIEEISIFWRQTPWKKELTFFLEVKRLKFALSKLRVQQGKTSKMRPKQALRPTRTYFDDWPACCCLKSAAAVVGSDRKKYQRKKIFSKNRTFRVTFPSFHTKKKKKLLFTLN